MNMRSLAFVIGVVAALGLAACKSSSSSGTGGTGTGGTGTGGTGVGGGGFGGANCKASGDPCDPSFTDECCSGTCDSSNQCM
jgi:hypothetical protein